MAVFSISVPDALMEQVDEAIERRGFAGRSDLARTALREFLNRDREDRPGNAERSATLTLLYEEGSERRIGEIRHDYTDILDAAMHAHAHGMCLELFILKGRGDRIREFGDRLRGVRETQLVQTVYTDAPPSAGARAHPHHHAHSPGGPE